MDRKGKIKQIHFRAQRLKVCLKCDELFIGSVCPKCGAKDYRDSDKIDYRLFLQKNTGKTSSKDMTDEELDAVWKALYDAGWKDRNSEQRQAAWEARKKTRFWIRKEAKRVLGDYSDARVESFCLKVMGKELDKLNEKELRRVIGWIHRKEKSIKKEQEALDTI